MKISKTLVIFLVVALLMLALAKSTKATGSNEVQSFFSADYVGISLRVFATNETVPGENITVQLWANYTASRVDIDYFNLSTYGFNMGGPERTYLNLTSVAANESRTFNQTLEKEYNLFVPNDVYGQIYCEVQLKYTVVDEPIQRNPSFAITYVKNVYFENLKENYRVLNESYGQLNQTYQQLNDTYGQLNENYGQLNQTYWQLNDTYGQLNQTYWQLNETYNQLNQTYWELHQNYTELEGTTSDLDNTRRLAVILGITTASFVATTLYLIMKKPREPW